MTKIKGNLRGTQEGGRFKSRNNPGEACLRQKGNLHAGIQRNLRCSRGNNSWLSTQKIKHIEQIKLLLSLGK